MAFEEKYLRVPEPIVVSGRHLKRYHINCSPEDIDEGIQGAAYAVLPELLPEPDEDTPPAGFIVLHRGRDGAAYLNAYSWVWGNVLHSLNATAGQPLLDCPDEDPTNFVRLDRPWIGCIWELPALGHERSAWVKHVFARETPDLEGYLADRLLEGRTGGPDYE